MIPEDQKPDVPAWNPEVDECVASVSGATPSRGHYGASFVRFYTTRGKVVDVGIDATWEIVEVVGDYGDLLRMPIDWLATAPTIDGSSAVCTFTNGQREVVVRWRSGLVRKPRMSA